MSGFALTKAAEQDLVEIARYTLEAWGRGQCERYIGDLDDAFSRLAEDPKRGRPCDRVRPGILRYQQGKHVIFYRAAAKVAKYHVLIVRVLHERMLPERHL